MYLDALDPLHAEVGYGSVGRGGDLGYDGMRVTVAQRTYEHALATHPPARLAFDLGGRYASFTCKVALNDDVPRGRSYADFSVRADGRIVGAASYVLAGSGSREIVADIGGAQRLELLVSTSLWNYAHAVWLDPLLSTVPLSARPTFTDCLGRAEIERVAVPPAERCIGTVVSPGFEGMLDDMLGSLLANGNVPDARLVVFAANANDRCMVLAAKYGAVLVPCRPLRKLNASIKSVLYSMASVVDAEHFLALDADILITGDLSPLFSSLDAVPETSVLAARDGNGRYWRDLEHVFREGYSGTDAEAATLELSEADRRYPLVVNDGVFAATRKGIEALDAVIRGMPGARQFLDGAPSIGWRNQLILNLALARLDCGVELDGAWNVQLHATEVQWDDTTPLLRATWRGRTARAVHFSGWSKQKYPQVQGRYARAGRPLVAPTPGDGYARFVEALRCWIGGHGLDSMAWSFYGTTDGGSARVADASVFPLFATLHYLIRGNGCTSVLECGTARGVSAGCIASAVAHRSGGRVVTLDYEAWPQREAFWKALPESMRACIEPRQTGSLEGMRAALEAGEAYDAALLDTLHTAEHVWAEFELACRLVCPGGLILIHDPLYEGGTVEGALKRIEQAGYGVVRLWSAERGVREDDHLGLAVIENRIRSAWRESGA
jgi:predicted O-methyltransferase YrrM